MPDSHQPLGSARAHELRIHGVAATPHWAMLGPPEQVACRPDPDLTVWKQRPEDLERRPVRAYRWSNLTSGKRHHALWILFTPFTFANVAGWMMLPVQDVQLNATDDGQVDAHHMHQDRPVGRGWGTRWICLFVRLAALLVTLILVNFIALIVVDLGAWQAADANPWWVAGSVVGVAVIMGVVTRVSWPRRRTKSLPPPKLWDDDQMEDPVGYAGLHHGQWRMWDSPGLIARLSLIHLAASWAALSWILAQALNSMGGPAWTVGLASTMLLLPVVLLALLSLGDGRRPRGWLTSAVRWAPPFALTVLVFVGGLLVSRLGDVAPLPSSVLPGVRGAGAGIAGGLVVVLAAATLVQWLASRGYRIVARAVWNLPGLMLVAAGIASAFGAGLVWLAAAPLARRGSGVVCGAAVPGADGERCAIEVGTTVDWLAVGVFWTVTAIALVTGIRFAQERATVKTDAQEPPFQIALARLVVGAPRLVGFLTCLTAAAVVGVVGYEMVVGLPPAEQLTGVELSIPWFVGLSMAAALASLLVASWLTVKEDSCSPFAPRVSLLTLALFAVPAIFVVVAPLLPLPGGAGWPPVTLGGLVTGLLIVAVARLIWAISPRAALVSLAVFGVLVVFGQLGWLGWTGLPADAARTHLAFARYTGLVLPAMFIGWRVIVGGLRNENTRRQVGILWDVGTFWPRWFHPYAPPTYSDRAVTDFADLIANEARPRHGVLVAGHSQGSVIAAASLLLLPQPRTVRDGSVLPVDSEAWQRIALLTFGSPLGGLYAEFFPAYVNAAALEQLAKLLRNNEATQDDRDWIRWVNFRRVSDAIASAPTAGTPPLKPRTDSCLTAVDRDAWVDPEQRVHSGYWLEKAYKEEADHLVDLIRTEGKQP